MHITYSPLCISLYMFIMVYVCVPFFLGGETYPHARVYIQQRKMAVSPRGKHVLKQIYNSKQSTKSALSVRCWTLMFWNIRSSRRYHPPVRALSTACSRTFHGSRRALRYDPG